MLGGLFPDVALERKVHWGHVTGRPEERMVEKCGGVGPMMGAEKLGGGFDDN